jgi:hypothetical protein
MTFKHLKFLSIKHECISEIYSISFIISRNRFTIRSSIHAFPSKYRNMKNIDLCALLQMRFDSPLGIKSSTDGRTDGKARNTAI